MSRSWVEAVEALVDADLGGALLYQARTPLRAPLLDLQEALSRPGAAAWASGVMDDDPNIGAGLTLLLPDLSPPASRVPSTASSLGQPLGQAEGSVTPASPFRRTLSRPLLLGQDAAASPTSALPADLRHGLGRRHDLQRDLHAELRADMGLLSDTLSRRASRERLIRRQLLGQRVDRNRSLQEVASLDDSRTASMSLSATRLPEIHALHDSSSARSLVAKKPSSESQDVEAVKDDTKVNDGGDEGGDDVQEALMSLLECPVCRDFLQPPIKQCSNGHVVCFTCWPRLSLCPACRAPFIPTASLTLDGILRTLRFPCPNKEHGCTLTLRMDARPSHDLVCAHRPRGCPMARCEWQGLADALAPHCQQAHAPIHVERHVVVSVPFQVDRAASSLDGVPTIVHHEQRLFSLSGARPGEIQIFLFQSRYDLWRSKFFAEMVRVAGDPRESTCSWQVELRSSGTQLCLRCPVVAAASAQVGPVLGTPPAGSGPPTPYQPPNRPLAGLKLDLDVFNQFMEAGKYSLRIALH